MLTKCPKIRYPYPYITYKCQEQYLFIDYFISKLLLNAEYFQYIRTGIDNCTKYRREYSYIVPIYHFKYYSMNKPRKLLKTYTYEEIFNISLIAQQYKTPESIPEEIKNKLDEVDLEFYCSTLLLPNLDQLYNAVRLANEYKQNGLQYFFTYNLPKYFCLEEPTIGQKKAKCYSGAELITIARNAQSIVDAYES